MTEHEELTHGIENLERSAEIAKRTLAAHEGLTWWTVIWQGVVILGIVITLIFAGIILNDVGILAHQNNQLLNTHGPQIAHIQKVTDSICQHTPGCVIPGHAPTP